MLKLGDALDGWRPRPGGGSDPLVAARAAWLELAGADVARAAQPVAIERDTLVVLTVSSSWSHQLAFLEPEIVRGLAAIPETSALTRLRFRVGKLRRPLPVTGTPGAPLRTGAGYRETPRDDEPPARTLDDALARLRRTVERTRAEHRARGGIFCALCDAPLDAAAPAVGPVAGSPAAGMSSAMCRPCRDDRERRRRFTCERLLYEAPWLGADEVMAGVDGLDPGAFDTIRRRLLRSWWDELKRASILHKLRQPLDRPRLRKIASSFVLLETRMDPTRMEMDSPVRKNALAELYDFVRTIEADPSTTVEVTSRRPG